MLIHQTDLRNHFDQAFEKCSLHQRKLVNATDGPVRALISSSSNISRLFALRMANILSVSKSPSANILCFMTTAQKVQQVKIELALLTNNATAKQNVHTVPSFCKTVIDRYVLQTNNKLPKLISTLETVQLLKELIAAFPANHPLKKLRANVYAEINHLHKLFTFLKQQGVSTKYHDEQIATYINCIIAGDATPTGYTHCTNKEVPNMIEKLRAAIVEFTHWEKILQKNNRCEAEDLIATCIKILEENEQLLSVYQQQFQYLQADEQAFTGIPANKLLHLLLGKNKHSNILLTKCIDEYSNKSTANIFHSDTASEFLVDWTEIKAEPAIDHSKMATKRNLPVITLYQSTDAALAGIVNKVSALLQENIAPSKIAIVSPGAGYGKILQQCFTIKNIPFYSNQNVDLLQQPFLKKIIQLLRYISTEIEMPLSGDDLLFEILHYDFFRVSPVEIARLSIQVNSKKYGSNPTAIRKLLQERANAPARDLFDTGMEPELKKTSLMLEKLIQDAASITPEHLLEKILQDTQVHSYVEKSDDRSWLMQLLNAWTGFIKEETVQNPGLPLNELLAALDTMQTEGFPIYISHTTGSADGVQILQPEQVRNAAADYLFIIDVNDWKPAKIEWVDLIGQVYPTAAFPLPDATIDSRQRLFNHLLQAAPNVSIALSKIDMQEQECTPSGFVAKIISQYALTVVEAPDIKWNKPALKPAIAPLEAGFITPIVNKFVMNVSALNSYLKCPLGFYYKNILRIPTGKSEALEFGSAIHYALEQLFKKMASGNDSSADNTLGKEQFPSAVEMIADFKLYMHRQRAAFTQEAFERRMASGKRILQNYYAEYVHSWNKVVSVERNIRGVTVNGVPLKGKLDKLEFNGKEVTIVDYKTGDIEKALLQTKPPNVANPNGGDYWRQAVFYKILVDHYNGKSWKVVGSEIDFIEPDNNGQYRKMKIQINAPDTETVTQQLTATWHKIQAHDFYTGCGKLHCHWCNFVKDNRLAVAM